MGNLNSFFDNLPFKVSVSHDAHMQYDDLLAKNSKIVAIYGHAYNGKWYIGQTSQFSNLIRRFGTDGNRYLLKNRFGEYTHPKFARAIKKYGWSAFSHHIFGFYSNNDANDAERYWIAKMDSQNIGYNTAPGGQQAVEHLSQNAKISTALKGHKVNDETRKKISESLKHSEKYKKSRKGLERYLFKPGNENISCNRSLYNKTKKLHPQNGTENAFYGKAHTEHTRELIREAASKRLTTKDSINKRKQSLAITNAERSKEKEEHPERFIGNSKPLAMMTASGNILRTFKSSMAASKYANVSRQLITNCARGKAYTAGGYYWKFILPKEVTDDI